MKKKKVTKLICVLMCLILLEGCLWGCTETTTAAGGSEQDKENTMDAADVLQTNQPTPTDINYSLERYNLIRRAYWVNGQREKANTLICEVEKPLGYVVLISGNTIIGSFVVDGKVSSLNSYLTPDSEWYEQCYWSDGDSYCGANDWIADVDGSYGENDAGIFFFTPDGKYIEWTGTYLYSDIPFIVDDPVLTISDGGTSNE